MARDAELAERYRAARRDPALAVLEGFHALKHAVRFGAEILDVAAAGDADLAGLAAALAPDLAETVATATPLPRDRFEALSPTPPATGVVTIARRPEVDPAKVLASVEPAPVVLLERPRRLENVGAVVRVAAAAGAAGVLTTGEHDPWHPAALRGSTGLHFALPVARVRWLPAHDRPLVALDPSGEDLSPDRLPPRALLAFGTERAGLGAELLAASDFRLRIPMREGVSSLNLATAVAAVLYVWRLGARA